MHTEPTPDERDRVFSHFNICTWECSSCGEKYLSSIAPSFCPKCGVSHDAGLDGAIKDVQRAGQIIAAARDGNGPPVNPPSMLWSALCSMCDHLDTLQRAIAAGEYSEAS